MVATEVKYLVHAHNTTHDNSLISSHNQKPLKRIMSPVSNVIKLLKSGINSANLIAVINSLKNPF